VIAFMCCLSFVVVWWYAPFRGVQPLLHRLQRFVRHFSKLFLDGYACIGGPEVVRVNGEAHATAWACSISRPGDNQYDTHNPNGCGAVCRYNPVTLYSLHRRTSRTVPSTRRTITSRCDRSATNTSRTSCTSARASWRFPRLRPQARVRWGLPCREPCEHSIRCVPVS
jgi:hypothetical protein